MSKICSVDAALIYKKQGNLPRIEVKYNYN